MVVHAPAPPDTVRRLRAERQVLLRKAGRHFRTADGYEPSHFTLRRWHLSGLRGGAVRLEAYRSGRDLVTSVEAIERFLAALTATQSGTPAAPAPRPDVERELADAGI